MKKQLITILTLILIVGFFAFAGKNDTGTNAGMLYTATYTSVYKDTVTVNGTNAGSDWFTNSSAYNDVWVQVYNGAFWYTAKIDFPCRYITKFKVQLQGADSSVTVAAFLGGDMTINVPLTITPYIPPANDWLTNAFPGYNWYLSPTTAIWVQFEGIPE